ncbi:23S rRNA (guanosine2251-2'-O)-methyltransferase [Pullulanibacillus pueri]|uniref:Putative TrmH family tRNA/rRNA methyltransferase YacO n=1 Tax=Pullulanibacillus pueri TaxID=1437324 RepID=A0A8J2ZXN8_9BACL|nr:23S rRNA (guanosine(2251)-2'-O)-methyltransferase RlmB [Pullulanibacillus pueri]MBM7683156.1 23S rRNA (guanosine2251-2'-O)-methyltransferase [Pullulanibacillus pueri]GGH85448.1 putative TrmH family tRNA/rRNA methyltransferase YacO [Pullulanibacillus pueri]
MDKTSGEFIVGRHPIAEAIKAGREINKIWINEKGKGLDPDLLKVIKEQKINFQFVPKQKIDQLAGSTTHQGMVASVAAHRYATVDELFNKARAVDEQPFFILLDGLEDPHNLGSVLRTADAVGAHGVIVGKNRAVGLTSTVAKASTGAIEHVPVARVTNLARTMEDLKSKGVWIVGTDADQKQSFQEITADVPICIVIGNEGKGMSRLVRDKCDYLVSIPMRGHVTSLNASVAAALLMYEVYRHRLQIGD